MSKAKKNLVFLVKLVLLVKLVILGILEFLESAEKKREPKSVPFKKIGGDLLFHK